MVGDVCVAVLVAVLTCPPQAVRTAIDPSNRTVTPKYLKGLIVGHRDPLPGYLLSGQPQPPAYRTGGLRRPEHPYAGADRLDMAT